MKKAPAMERCRGRATITGAYLWSFLKNKKISLHFDSSKSKKGFDNNDIKTLKEIKECIDSPKSIQRALNQKIKNEYKMQNPDADDSFKDDQMEAAIKSIISQTKLFESMKIDKSDVMSSEKNTVDEIISRDKNLESSPVFDTALDSEDSNEFLLADSDNDESLYNYDLGQNNVFYDNDICSFEI